MADGEAISAQSERVAREARKVDWGEANPAFVDKLLQVSRGRYIMK